MPLQTALSLPAGSITQYAGAAAPEGWLLSFGQAVSRSTYAALFLAIGTTYGVGDGSTTFNLPDFRGRLPVGKDNMGGTTANRVTVAGSGLNGTTLGAAGGAEIVTLTTAQLPSHTHPVTNAVPQTGTTNAGGSSATAFQSGTVTATATGSGNSHSNLPPALIINYIIKT